MKFRNEAYSELVSDLINDAFYIESRSKRGTISTIRQYAEVIVRKILDLSDEDKVTLGDHRIIKQLKVVSDNNPLLMSSIENIRLIGNDCTHTQSLLSISDDDVSKSVDSLFNLYASLFVIYFEKHKFGLNSEIVRAFSILPPIIRYIALNELYKKDKSNISVIDKLSLVLLKAFDENNAITWIEERKSELSKTLPYTLEATEGMKKNYGSIVTEQIIDNAPDNMYISCLERVNDLSPIIQTNGVLYNNFEQAKQLYLDKGILQGEKAEIIEFNSVMEFVYLGRNIKENKRLENINSYLVTK